MGPLFHPLSEKYCNLKWSTKSWDTQASKLRRALSPWQMACPLCAWVSGFKAVHWSSSEGADVTTSLQWKFKVRQKYLNPEQHEEPNCKPSTL